MPNQNPKHNFLKTTQSKGEIRIIDILAIILSIIVGLGILSVVGCLTYLGYQRWTGLRELTQQEISQQEEPFSSSKILEEETVPLVEKEAIPKETTSLIFDKFVKWGHKTPLAPRAINTIIVHSVYDALGQDLYSLDGVIEEFKLYHVSSHYLIDRNGSIYRLVADKDIAYHAGTSKMPDGRINVNNFSIGIELIYHETESPVEAQYQSLAQLVKYLQSKYEIPSTYILGHKDIAPSRKTDPWNFDWGKFNEMLKD